jgi:hypothetical protein
VLAAGAFDLDLSGVSLVLMIAVAGLTVASAAAYLVEWMAHMTSGPPPSPGAGQDGVDRP